MEKAYLVERIKTHLHVLCNEIGERRVGSEKNRLATDYAGKILKEYGWQTEANKLSVIDWKTEGAELTCGDKSFEVFSSHYSLGCSVEGELIAIDTIDKLEQSNITDKIVLLYGDISSQQIAPKKFPFWNPEEHQHLISVLERNRPLAIITATKRDSALAGGVYPFPILLNINIDGAGYHEGFSCFSPFNLPENVSTAFKDMLSDNPLIIEGLPWYQGDHSLFLQNRTPAIAVSSNWFIENMESQEITHTPKDNLGIVNFEQVAECAIGVRDLIRKIGS